MRIFLVRILRGCRVVLQSLKVGQDLIWHGECCGRCAIGVTNMTRRQYQKGCDSHLQSINKGRGGGGGGGECPVEIDVYH